MIINRKNYIYLFLHINSNPHLVNIMSQLSEYLEKLEEWDHKAFLHVYRSGFSKRSKKFSIVISFLGSLYFWGLIWLAWFIYGYVTKDYYLLVLFTGGFEQSIILHSIVKYRIIRRNRPYIRLKEKGVKKHDDFIRIPYIMRESDKNLFQVDMLLFSYFLPFIFKVG